MSCGTQVSLSRWILSLVVIAGAWLGFAPSLEAQASPPPRMRPDGTRVDEWVEQGLQLADKIMRKAVAKARKYEHMLTEEDKEALAKLELNIKMLERVRNEKLILWQKTAGEEYPVCGDRVHSAYMAVDGARKNIYICEAFLNERRVTLLELAESLIHEIRHLVQDRISEEDQRTVAAFEAALLADECDAADVQNTAMGWSDYGVTTTAYWVECGITPMRRNDIATTMSQDLR